MPSPAPARPLVLGLAALLLAGCLGSGSVPVPPVDEPPALPALACAEPCLRVVETGQGFAWEPHVAVNPQDPQHLVAGSTGPGGGHSEFWLYAHVSKDGGATWQTARLPGGDGADPTHPLASYNAFADPVVAFLPDGTVVFTGIAARRSPGVPVSLPSPVPVFATSGFSLFAAVSDDGGLTYPRVVRVAEGQGAYTPFGGALFENQDKPWIAAGPDGTLLLAWSEVLGGTPESLGFRCDAYVASSTDAAATWSAPQRLATGGCFLGAAPVLTEAGAWHIAYAEQSEGALVLATSRDGGATWDVAALGSTRSLPSLAVQRSAGERLWVAYAAPEGEDLEVPTVQWSDDDGATWSPPLTLDAPAVAGRTLPSVAADAEGAYVTFFHALAEDEVEYRAVRVQDGLASAPVVLQEAIPLPASRLGDYMGLAGLPEGAFAVWTTQVEDRPAVAGAALRPA